MSGASPAARAKPVPEGGRAAPRTVPVGAYGLRIAGVGETPSSLVPCPSDWPRLRIVASLEAPPAAAEWVDGERAELTLRTGGRLVVDRFAGTAHFRVPRRLSAEELVHPYLAPAASVVSHWLGRPSFHTGAFAASGGAWAVAGDRGAGKSSLLGWLAVSGGDVVADDVLVLDGQHALAGPRSVDLREDTASYLGVGRALGVVGARARWRLSLPGIAERLPFRGWFFLGWGDALEARRLSGSECLEQLLRHRSLRIVPAHPAGLLELATLPAWEVRRPRAWPALEAAGRLLLERAADET